MTEGIRSVPFPLPPRLREVIVAQGYALPTEGVEWPLGDVLTVLDLGRFLVEDDTPQMRFASIDLKEKDFDLPNSDTQTGFTDWNFVDSQDPAEIIPHNWEYYRVARVNIRSVGGTASAIDQGQKSVAIACQLRRDAFVRGNQVHSGLIGRCSKGDNVWRADHVWATFPTVGQFGVAIPISMGWRPVPSHDASDPFRFRINGRQAGNGSQPGLYALLAQPEFEGILFE